MAVSDAASSALKSASKSREFAGKTGALSQS
jgi:hypothetical protein